jgi:hypothetical protein
LLSNDKNRVRWAVLGLSQDGACIDLFENLSVNSFKGDLSNATTFKLPLFSLDNTFKTDVFFQPLFRLLLFRIEKGNLRSTVHLKGSDNEV